MIALVAALLGGAWGGAVVGLTEAALTTVTAGPGEDYWLFPYAVVSYGILGAGLGAAGALLINILGAAVGATRRSAFGSAAGVAVFLLAAAVTRYNVIQRVFHEELVTLSMTGIAVHVAIFVFATTAALAVMYVGGRLDRRTSVLPFAAVALCVCVVISSAAAKLASPGNSGPVTRVVSPAVKGHPNVIVIIADTLRADAVGIYGAGPQATPNLDRFAAEGVRFEHAYSQATWTRPSIATILTSLYPSVHGATHKFDALPDRVTTLAEALRAQGYWTAGFVSNINVAPVFNYQQGFGEYAYIEPSFYFWATDSVTRLAIYKILRVVRERFFRDRIYFYNYYQDAEVVGAAVTRWLEHEPPSPFFLLIHYMDPHDPYFEHPYNGHGVARVTNPNPSPDRKDELHGLYTGAVHYLDHHLGILLERFKRLGIYDNSVIIVTADHGEEFQEHGGWWHGTSLYEEQMHIPLIVKRAHEPHPGVESRWARTLDIAPTAMVAAGLPPPAEFEGSDLFAAGLPEQPTLFAEEDLEGNVLTALRVGPWKIVTANPDNPRGLKPVELYNLSEDAGERQNLAGREPSRTAEMLQLLTQERARIRGRVQLGESHTPPHAADHRS